MADERKELAPQGHSAGDLAVLGEGTPRRTQVSVQVLQDIYHELTGKSEEVSKSYDHPFQIEASDFDQLHHRVQQVCEQFNICANNCSITVFYMNDTRDNFSSFERFRAMNTGNTCAVESVLFTYNFLILLPKLKEPQSYTISIRIASPATIIQKMRQSSFMEVPRILRILGNRTAVISVKYIDYVVARNLLNAIDEWFGTLKKGYFPKFWKLILARTHYLPAISRYFVAAFGVATIYYALPRLIDDTTTTLGGFRIALICGAVLFAGYKMAHHVGSAAENSIDNWSASGYIKLTAGDLRQIEAASRRSMLSVFGGIAQFICALLVSVVLKLVIEKYVAALI